MKVQKDEHVGFFIPAISELTEKGIKYKGKYYSCQSAIRHQWFLITQRTRTLKVFVDTLNDDYLLISLEDGRLEVALLIQNHHDISEYELNEYYEIMNILKKRIKERKRKDRYEQ